MPRNSLHFVFHYLNGQPRAGVGPEIVCAAGRNFEDFGDFSESDSSGIAELGEFCDLSIHLRQSFESITNGENLFGWLPERIVFIRSWL